MSKFGPKPIPVKERIRLLFTGETGCWVLPSKPLPNGYARMNGKLAHRLVYEALVGEIPAELTLDHLCRNKACVNPTHLEPVAQRVNSFRAPNYVGNRTECPQGHAYIPENTNINKKTNRRTCLACHRAHQLAYTARLVERSLSSALQ